MGIEKEEKGVIWRIIKGSVGAKSIYVYTIKKNNENKVKKCAKQRKKALQMYFQYDKIEKLRKTGDEAEGC